MFFEAINLPKALNLNSNGQFRFENNFKRTKILQYLGLI